MTVYLVRDRKYMSLIELCATKTVAENFIAKHGKEQDWFFVERTVVTGDV